jgi:hypothetical protein
MGTDAGPRTDASNVVSLPSARANTGAHGRGRPRVQPFGPYSNTHVSPLARPCATLTHEVIARLPRGIQEGAGGITRRGEAKQASWRVMINEAVIVAWLTTPEAGRDVVVNKQVPRRDGEPWPCTLSPDTCPGSPEASACADNGTEYRRERHLFTAAVC